MEQNFNLKDIISKKNIEEEIEIIEIFSFLFRNKIFIGTITFLSFILLVFYFLTLKKVWEGQFQIVLN